MGDATLLTFMNMLELGPLESRSFDPFQESPLRKSHVENDGKPGEEPAL